MDKIIKESGSEREMKKIGVDPAGIKIMKEKSVFKLVKLCGIKPALANIIKESMLSAGGDAALHKLACACKVESTDILLMGTIKQYRHLLQNLDYQPFGGKEASRRISRLLKLF